MYSQNLRQRPLGLANRDETTGRPEKKRKRSGTKVSQTNDAIWREIMLRFIGATAPLLQAASSVSCGKQCPLRIGGASNTTGMERATCDRACCRLPVEIVDCMTRRARIPVRRISYRGLGPARQLSSVFFWMHFHREGSGRLPSSP